MCRGDLGERTGGVFIQKLCYLPISWWEFSQQRSFSEPRGAFVISRRTGVTVPFNDAIMAYFVNISFQTVSGVTGNTGWTDLRCDIRYWQSLFYGTYFSLAVLKECWHGTVSSLSTPHSTHSLKASCDLVLRKPQSHTRAAETGGLGWPQALHLGFLSQDLSAQRLPDTRWWTGQVSPLTILPKGRDS